MTSNHLFPILESEEDSELFVQVCALLAVGNVPDEIIDAIRLGWMTALSKPDGGVRGIVGHLIRRLLRERSRSPGKLKRQLFFSNTPSQRKQGVSASLTSVRHSLILTRSHHLN